MNYISTLIIDFFFLNVVFGDYASTSKRDYFYLIFKTIHTFLILHIRKKKNLSKNLNRRRPGRIFGAKRCIWKIEILHLGL